MRYGANGKVEVCTLSNNLYALYQVFFKENVRYPVWICRDPISLILGTQ